MNRLAEEKSPYLLQHADNPVHWYAWGEEPFQKAAEEDKPVFLSIGYATCHWCHVMAHESFEDPEVAGLMNDHFINIKVDREERPDIDNTYMLVCQMLTGSGGWPLSVFLTPDKEPFYAATYIPKQGRHGRPGMLEVIPWLADLWENKREKINRSTSEIISAFKKSTHTRPGDLYDEVLLNQSREQFEKQFDAANGGFGSPPKFPSPHNLLFLLRQWKRTGSDHILGMVTKTLEAMRRGGLFDQVGYGFHRYSTDAEWLVPHFEKMLYDQALLLYAYTEAWQASGEPLFRQTADEIARYVLRDLQDEQGAFFSAEDADSEGEEGKFYVFETEELHRLLPTADAELAIELFNCRTEGNYFDEATRKQTGKNILHLAKPLGQLARERDWEATKLENKLESIRERLYEAREQRTRPLLDDKILTDWNGLMIAALAKAGAVFNRPQYIEQAEQAYAFIEQKLWPSGGLLHRYRDGDAAIDAHADDYAFLIWGLLELYEAGAHTRYLEQAVSLNTQFIEQCWDDEQGGFYFTGTHSEKLLARKKEFYDGAVPSANSVAMLNLVRLARMTGNSDYDTKAEQTGRLYTEQIRQAPTGFSMALCGIDFAIGPSREIVISGPPKDKNTLELFGTVQKLFLPNKVILWNAPDDEKLKGLAPFTANQPMQNNQPTAYVCQNYACEKPVHRPDELGDLLR